MVAVRGGSEFKPDFNNRCVEYRSRLPARVFGPFTQREVGLCLEYSGGPACYSQRWDAQFYGNLVGIGSVDPKTVGAQFSQYYQNQYQTIYREAKEFWPNAYGCAAFASTALKLFGFDIDQVLVTNPLETQVIALGWQKITNLALLEPGDLVFTDKRTSNIPNTWSHVYVFHSFVNQRTVTMSDNNGNRIRRNLWGGPQSNSIVAYRPR